MGHQAYGQLLHCMYTLQVSLELVTSSKIVAVPNPRRLVSRYRVRDMVIELLSLTFLPHLFTLSEDYRFNPRNRCFSYCTFSNGLYQVQMAPLILVLAFCVFYYLRISFCFSKPDIFYLWCWHLMESNQLKFVKFCFKQFDFLLLIWHCTVLGFFSVLQFWWTLWQ